jgi:hypothetical protein
MLSSDPERNWFRIAKASLTSSTSLWLISALASADGLNKRISDAEWRGNLQNGGGTVSLANGAFNGLYSYKYESSCITNGRKC